MALPRICRMARARSLHDKFHEQDAQRQPSRTNPPGRTKAPSQIRGFCRRNKTADRPKHRAKIRSRDRWRARTSRKSEQHLDRFRDKPPPVPSGHRQHEGKQEARQSSIDRGSRQERRPSETARCHPWKCRPATGASGTSTPEDGDLPIRAPEATANSSRSMTRPMARYAVS